ncbi:MAG: methyltransferase domain-containing protein [Chitinophagaceae bacterium]
MTREEKVLEKIEKEMPGLEIGPSHAPLAPKKKGYNVHIIDHMNQTDLIKKYTGHGVNLQNIEEVDFIWNGQSYAALTGKPGYYNWIIASHVIEHTPDLIRFLQQCGEVLTEDGVISLVVPDIRYHFDYFRPITGISKVIDAYYNNHVIHSAGTAAEYLLNVTTRNGQIAWHEGAPGEFALLHSLDDTRDNIQRIVEKKEYIDFHSWSFTPTSFRLLIRDLNDLGFISLKEVLFYPTDGCEFYITLGNKGQGFLENRLDALKTIKSELSVQP